MKFQLMRSPDACENYCTRFRGEIPESMHTPPITMMLSPHRSPGFQHSLPSHHGRTSNHSEIVDLLVRTRTTLACAVRL